MKTLLPVLLCGVGLLVGGCGSNPGDDDPTDANPAAGDPSAADGIRRISPADLGIQIGEYLPRLEGGRLEVAAPAGWDWRNPSDPRHLVGFILSSESSLNELPRILVQVEDAAGFSVTTVDDATLPDFLREVRAELTADEMRGGVEAIVVGQRPCISFTSYARRGNASVRQRFVKTLVAGRMYTVQLQAYDRVFPKYEDAALAVIASLRFPEPVEDVSPSGSEASVPAPNGVPADGATGGPGVRDEPDRSGETP